MQKVFFVVTTSNHDKATRAFQFAKIAADEGNLAGIMLVDDAVYIVQGDMIPRVRAVTGDMLHQHLDGILASDGIADVTLLVCKPCCAARGISQEDLHPAFKMGTGLQAMENVMADGVTTLTF